MISIFWEDYVNSYFNISHMLLKQLPEYTDPKFIKYLFEEHNMKMRKTILVSRLITNHEITYSVKEEDGNRTWFDKQTYKTENGQFTNNDWDKFYEEYRKN